MIKEFKDEFTFLSNFFPCKIKLGDCEFNSVEHAYQACKAKFGSEEFEKIRTAPTPGIAKKLGRKVKLPEDWDTLKVMVMMTFVELKFRQNKQLAKQLLATGDEELQEGNNWGDDLWGVDLKTGKGKNLLGQTLMMIRKSLKNETEFNKPI